MRIPLTILIGPTCGGKTTLFRYMVDNLGYVPFVTHTDRPPREGEVDGLDYIFLDPQEFKRQSDAGWFCCERKFRVKSGDTYSYGVDDAKLRKMIHDCSAFGVVMILDFEGAQEIKPDIQTLYQVIMVTAPETELIARAMRRGDRADETLDRIQRERSMFENTVNNRQVDLVVSTVNPEIEFDSKKISPREFYAHDYHRAD